jgi:hypothetical protein
LDTNIVGLPSGNAMNVAAVGPMVELGMVAVADRSNGPMAGIRYGSSSVTAPPTESTYDSSDPALVTTVPAKNVRTEALTAIAARDPENASLVADRRALAQAEWLVRLAVGFGEQFGLSSSVPNVTAGAGSKSPVADSTVLVQNPANQRKSIHEPRTSVNSAQLDAGLPLGVVVMAAVSYRMRRPLRRWWRARQDLPSMNHDERLPLGHGPHHRLLGNGSTRSSNYLNHSTPTVARIR